MVSLHLRLGGKLRRLRQSRRLTQAQMAEALGLSASYLNLLEHNQRAMTVPVLLKLAQRFGIDVTDFTADEDARQLSDLMEVFADPLFDATELKAADVEELIASAPNMGRAILTLYQAYRAGGAMTAPGSGLEDVTQTPAPAGIPSEEVTDFLQTRKNYFKEIESAAETLWQKAELSSDALYAGLVKFLAESYAVEVRCVPADALGGLLRHYDPRRRTLRISELLPPSSRSFQLAHQLALLDVYKRQEMPGLYGDGEYDLAGFALGAVERAKLITGHDVAPGDCVLGLGASGIHSNGFSLVRRILADDGLALTEKAPFAPDISLAQALLTPTRIYVKPILTAMKTIPVKAMAHITGGGLIENIPRVLPRDLGVVLDANAWQAPAVMGWLFSRGVPLTEMARVFNCGIGMVILVAETEAEAAQAVLAAAGERVFKIGRVESARGTERVQIQSLEAAWRG